MSARRRVIAFVRYRYWRLLGRHIAGYLDRRWEAAHPFPIKLGCGPWSFPGEPWHGCPEGHDWERIDWPYGRAKRRGSRPDRITRCANCGAPRCSAYHSEGEGGRCTLERHHVEAHDYLDGTRIEVGA